MKEQEIIREAMSVLEINQGKLAALAGYESQSAISNKLYGKSMRVDTFSKLLAAMGFTVCVKGHGQEWELTDGQTAKVAPATPNLEMGNPISPSETSRMPQDASKRQPGISGVKDTSASITGQSDKPEPLIDSMTLDDMLADAPESQEPPRRPGRIRLSK